MSWEPTPEQIKRVAREMPFSSKLKRREYATYALLAFVPEGTVPVFLTREELEAWSLTPQGTWKGQEKLLAALKEAEGSGGGPKVDGKRKRIL